MPRKVRIHSPGVVHHVMSRGIDGCAILRDDADRNQFIRYLSDGLSRTGCKCYGWALMSNHYHLVIRLSDIPIGNLMRRLNSTYALYFNRKSNRRGYLFQDRFKSIPTQDQLYLEELIRYVHLNPLRAGLCKNFQQLNRYPWCGHSCLMGIVERPFQDTKPVLKRFGSNTAIARKGYADFIRAGLDDEKSEFVLAVRQNNRGRNDIGRSSCWVIGDTDFVTQTLARDKENRVRIAAYARSGMSMSDLAVKVAKALGVKTKNMRKKNRVGIESEARKILAYLGHRVYEIPVIDIGRYLGTGGPAVSMSLDEGEKLFSRHRIVL